MHEIDLSRAEWHKSSHSSQDGNCVEVASNLPGMVAVRDSKDRQGPVLAFDYGDWQAIIRQIKDRVAGAG
jgi:uncharacterized protein DUF397